MQSVGRGTPVVQLVGQGVQAGETKLEHKGGVGARGPQGPLRSSVLTCRTSKQEVPRSKVKLAGPKCLGMVDLPE